jgi:hypothetical protein
MDRRCPLCKEWNTYHEEVVATGRSEGLLTISKPKKQPELLSQIKGQIPIHVLKQGYQNLTGFSEEALFRVPSCCLVESPV